MANGKPVVSWETFHRKGFGVMYKGLAERGLSSVDQAVFLAIAAHVDRTGTAYLSAGTIARLSKITRRTVFRSIEHLQESGLLVLSHTKRTDGKPGFGTNRYRLVWPGGGDTGTPPVVTQDHQGSDTVSRGVVTQEHGGGVTGTLERFLGTLPIERTPEAGDDFVIPFDDVEDL